MVRITSSVALLTTCAFVMNLFFPTIQPVPLPLEGRPPHTLHTSISLSLPWKIDLYTRWRTVTDAFIDEFVRSPGFSTLDMRVGRALWSKAQGYVGVTNLLGAQKDPTRLGDQRPIEGRTFYVGIRSDYPFGED